LPEALACPMPLIDEVLDYRERVEVLVRALRSMPQLRREIFLRNRLDGHQVSVIASELAMTRSAVDKRRSPDSLQCSITDATDLLR